MIPFLDTVYKVSHKTPSRYSIYSSLSSFTCTRSSHYAKHSSLCGGTTLFFTTAATGCTISRQQRSSLADVASVLLHQSAGSKWQTRVCKHLCFHVFCRISQLVSAVVRYNFSWPHWKPHCLCWRKRSCNSWQLARAISTITWLTNKQMKTSPGVAKQSRSNAHAHNRCIKYKQTWKAVKNHLSASSRGTCFWCKATKGLLVCNDRHPQSPWWLMTSQIFPGLCYTTCM